MKKKTWKKIGNMFLFFIYGIILIYPIQIIIYLLTGYLPNLGVYFTVLGLGGLFYYMLSKEHVIDKMKREGFWLK